MAHYSKEQKAEWARAQYWKDREKILARNKTDEVRSYKAEWAREDRKKNPEKARAYNNAWVAQRRAEWLAKNGPCKECGSSKRLEVDHIDPKKKVHHRVWTWGENRRNAELAKCQVLCFLCHRLKTNKERGWRLHGEIMWQKGCRCDVCVKTHKKKLRTKLLGKSR